VGEDAVDQITEHARPNAGLERDALTMWQKPTIGRGGPRGGASVGRACRGRHRSGQIVRGASSRELAPVDEAKADREFEFRPFLTFALVTRKSPDLDW